PSPPTTDSHPLPLPDALPISLRPRQRPRAGGRQQDEPGTEEPTADVAVLLLVADDSTDVGVGVAQLGVRAGLERPAAGGGRDVGDRKSTRLNSSHVKISYAVF